MLLLNTIFKSLDAFNPPLGVANFSLTFNAFLNVTIKFLFALLSPSMHYARFF